MGVYTTYTGCPSFNLQMQLYTVRDYTLHLQFVCNLNVCTKRFPLLRGENISPTTTSSKSTLRRFEKNSARLAGTRGFLITITRRDISYPISRIQMHQRAQLSCDLQHPPRASVNALHCESKLALRTWKAFE